MISTSKIGVAASRGGGGGGVAPYVFILDEYPAYSGFSLQKMKSGYSGSAIRVRRSSDNAEQDIGFTDNNLDSSSLLTFVGVGDGFITTVYTQNGTSNFIQTTANSQPKIVSSGALITDTNGLAAMQFDGVDDYFTNDGIGGPYELDSYQVGSTTDNNFVMFSGALTDYSYVIEDGGTSTMLHSSYGTPSLYVNNVLKSVSNRDQVHAAISIGTPSVVNHFNAHPNRWWIAVRVGSYWTSGYEYDGLIQEFVFYDVNNTDADRSAITTILMDKYVP